jgi:superfamily II DNA or RNA helicase
MSRKISLNNLSEEQRDTISKELQIKIEASEYMFNGQAKYIYPYDLDDDNLYVPFAYSREYDRPDRKDLTPLNVKFVGNLRDYQKDVSTEAINHLNKYGSSVIASFPGFGKTFIGIYLATKLKLKTIILVHRIVLVNQWKDSIKRFCPDAIVQYIETKTKIKPADFYIMNAENVGKKGRDIFKDVGVLIVDELHVIMAEMLSQSLQFLSPRYVLGLSATPYRTDGLDPLINLYFGKKRIVRKLYRDHKVYQVNTGFSPIMEMSKNGRVNWKQLVKYEMRGLFVLLNNFLIMSF